MLESSTKKVHPAVEKLRNVLGLASGFGLCGKFTPPPDNSREFVLGGRNFDHFRHVDDPDYRPRQPRKE